MLKEGRLAGSTTSGLRFPTGSIRSTHGRSSSLLLDIFQFKHLVRQFRLCIFNLVLLAGWNIAYIALAWKRTHESGLSFSPEWPAALPIVAIVLICLGMRGIMRDILMLKSLDRLR